MTDSSLDDFFAKKDKSKKKTKAKLTTTDVLAKADDTPRKAKKKKDKEQPGGPGLSSVPQGTLTKEEEDEEWKDFEEEKKVDYSGLRIQTLQISKDEEEREGGESDEDRDGEEGDDRREGASGPWNKSAASGAPLNASAFSQESEDKKEGSAGKKYVPPAQRTATPANPPRRKKEAPNISSEIDFPSLGGNQPPTASAWGSKSKFETSGTGDVETNPDHRRGVNLTLENKFSALQD